MLCVIYRIAGNFRLEKIFAFFAQARRGRKFFRRIILPSENFVTMKFLHAQVFTRGCQAVLVNVVATNATLDFLCLHCFSTPPEIDRAEDRARANTVPDIRAWRVHSRAPPTTSW